MHRDDSCNHGITLPVAFTALLIHNPLDARQYDSVLDHAPALLPACVPLQTGEHSVTAALVVSVLSRQLDDLEPTLTRHGYRLKDMAEQFDAKPAEIQALFRNQLDRARTAELRDRILAAGLPI